MLPAVATGAVPNGTPAQTQPSEFGSGTFPRGNVNLIAVVPREARCAVLRPPLPR